MKKVFIFLTILIAFCSMSRAEKMEQLGKGLSVWFDTGGPLGGSYNTVVYNGAKQAAFDLGIDLKGMYSDWSPEKMVENFKKALSAKPDGIIVMGHPGSSAYQPLIDEAEKKGIVISCVDTPLPELQANYSTKGFGYIGPNNYEQGRNAALETIRRFSLKKGDRVFVWGLKKLQTRGKRARGVLDVFKEKEINTDYQEISAEIDKDSSLGTPVITGYLSAHPDCKAILVDHGALTAQMENFLRAANYKPEDIAVTGFSLSPATVSAIEKGYVDLIGDAQPFLMGYISVLQVALTKKYGFSGISIDTGNGFIGTEDIGKVKMLAKKGIR